MAALKTRAKSLHHQVKLLEEENRALRVAIGLDGAAIEDRGTTNRMFRGEAVRLRVGALVFPIPKGWEYDQGLITWETKNGQAYVKLPIIKMEV